MLTCKGTFDSCLYVWGPEPHTPPSPLYKLYTCIHYTVYLFTQVRGGELNQREGYRSNSSQSWVEITNITDCISGL